MILSILKHAQCACADRHATSPIYTGAYAEVHNSICIYLYMDVLGKYAFNCVCKNRGNNSYVHTNTYINTHTYPHLYIYIHICVKGLHTCMVAHNHMCFACIYLRTYIYIY